MSDLRKQVLNKITIYYCRSVGGIEAEKACRQRWAEEERAKIDASVRGILATLLYCGSFQVQKIKFTMMKKLCHRNFLLQEAVS